MLEAIIERAKLIHGETYDYSLVTARTMREKTLILCRTHGAFVQTLDKHINGKQGCPKCKPTARVDVDEFLRRFAGVHGDALVPIAETYRGMFSKVDVVCPTHGVFSALPVNLLHKKTGCPKCANAIRGMKQRMSFDAFIRRAAEVHGGRYTYDSASYSHASQPMVIVCPLHGEFKQAPVKHLLGSGCPACSVEKRAKAMTMTRDEFISRATKIHGNDYDYSAVVYTSIKHPVEIQCKKHGAFYQTPDAHLAGKGCPLCVNQVSKWEREVTDFLHGVGVPVTRTRSAIPGVELDVFYNGVAVECNGLYWHSDAFENAKLRHIKKHRIAAANGIRLIQLFEDEWRFRRSAVENLLASAFGVAHRTFARECSISIESSASVSSFLDTYHIQGSARGSRVYGLRYNETLVAVMVFSLIRSERGVKNSGWELVRYASKGIVVGGASKLFSRFVRDVSPARVVSYSDNRLFNGKLYELIGFTKKHVTRPDYRVVVNGKRVHKANFKKSVLKSKYGLDVSSLSERELCEQLGYYRVYDCGLTKWEVLYESAVQSENDAAQAEKVADHATPAAFRSDYECELLGAG